MRIEILALVITIVVIDRSRFVPAVDDETSFNQKTCPVYDIYSEDFVFFYSERTKTVPARTTVRKNKGHNKTNIR